MWLDLKYGAHQLWRQPLVTLVTVLTLALGIGVNTAVYSLARGILRPLPVPDPDRVAVVLAHDKDTGFGHLSYADYRDLRTVSAFEQMAAAQVVNMTLKGGDEDASWWGEIVSPNYFETLALRPALGRAFDVARETEDAASLILSYRSWQRRFHGDPAILGRALTLNGHAFTVVGVAPAGFRGTTSIWLAPEYWISAGAFDRAYPGSVGDLDRRGATTFRLIGRLRAGVTAAQAQSQVAPLAARLARAGATTRPVDAVVLRESDTHPEADSAAMFRFASRVFLGLVALVLLVACANVANILLSRMAARQSEMAVRAAVGASVAQVARQLLIEGALLALLGGAAGVLLAGLALGAFQRIAIPTSLPVVLDTPLDRAVLSYAIGLSALSTLVFALAPALLASRTNLVTALRGDHRGAGPVGRLTWGRSMVVAQVALALVLTTAAALFARSAQRAERVDWGLDPQNVILASVDLRPQGYDEATTRDFERELVRRLAALPGAVAVTLAAPAPLEFTVDGGTLYPDGSTTTTTSAERQSMLSVVGPHYFDAMRTPIVAGRPFGDEDTAESPRVAVVNETLAGRLWPGSNPVGRTFALDRADAPRVTVVGVARDGIYRLPGEPRSSFAYLPLTQNHRPQMTALVRTVGDPRSAVPGIREGVRALDSRLGTFDVKTLDELIAGRALAPTRLASRFSAVFGALALCLSMVGLFGVMAYAVAQRRREIGIRIAVGASPNQIHRLVFGEGLRLAAVGGLIGVVGVALTLPLLRQLLVDKSSLDPLAFGAAFLLLAAVAVGASAIPALRATRVDPWKALRSS